MGDLLTPIFVKDDPDFVPPEDESVSYLLASNDLFLCRKHQFFTSIVPAKKFPPELEKQESSLLINYPKLSARYLSRIIGFFSVIAVKHKAEAICLLAWDSKSNRVRIIVPEQETFTTYLDLEYKTPVLEPHLQIFGDIHCHVDHAAYASHQDKSDETHRTGLHIVVGKITKEPPDFHVEAVVDGHRFSVKPEFVMDLDKYDKRLPKAAVPKGWIKKVKVKKTKWWSTGKKKKDQGQAHVGTHYPQQYNMGSDGDWHYHGGGRGEGLGGLNVGHGSGEQHYSLPPQQGYKPFVQTQTPAVNSEQVGQKAKKKTPQTQSQLYFEDEPEPEVDDVSQKEEVDTLSIDAFEPLDPDEV
tara:strand:- start:243 stop:1307 length:1065 start_codon:yes stop_codon:yes gene_type:complete